MRVVQTGSFTAVGGEQNTSQATISKRVAALENHLAVKLLSRSSRGISLTHVGAEYYDKCVAVISELDEAEANARSQIATPRGLLRVTAPIAIGRLLLAPILAEFLAEFPDIKIDLTLSDKFSDLISEGIDVAIRARKLEDSSLVARPLFDNPMLVVAAPSYLAQNGEPKSPADLTQHNCIVYSLLESGSIWHFSEQGKDLAIPVNGNISCNNGDTVLEVALSGLGIVQLPIWMVSRHIQAGRLKRLITAYRCTSIPINAIYLKNRYIPLKVRCFVDFVKNKFAENTLFQ